MASKKDIDNAWKVHDGMTDDSEQRNCEMFAPLSKDKDENGKEIHLFNDKIGHSHFNPACKAWAMDYATKNPLPSKAVQAIVKPPPIKQKCAGCGKIDKESRLWQEETAGLWVCSYKCETKVQTKISNQRNLYCPSCGLSILDTDKPPICPDCGLPMQLGLPKEFESTTEAEPQEDITPAEVVAEGNSARVLPIPLEPHDEITPSATHEQQEGLDTYDNPEEGEGEDYHLPEEFAQVAEKVIEDPDYKKAIAELDKNESAPAPTEDKCKCGGVYLPGGEGWPSRMKCNKCGDFFDLPG